MTFDPTLAAIRFGTGLSPRREPAQDVGQMLDDLAGPDRMDTRHAIPAYDEARPSLAQMYRANLLLREARQAGQEEAALPEFRAVRANAAERRVADHLATMARALDSKFGLRERLCAFWADHFTIRARAFVQVHLVTPYVEDAIRPHVTGRFEDMLKAVVLHPMMLLYLDQWRSTGPNSPLGQRQGRGLNENLARELLELHLLGVDGAYTQTDVRELAELLTGLVYHAERGFSFDRRMAEPGEEVVLGIRFDAEPRLETILAALETLAMLPETAAHLARKMAVHFIGPIPDPAMLARMERAYLDTGGNLLAMTAAMLHHPAAWVPERSKVRLPMEFITAGLRALGVTGRQIKTLHLRDYRRFVRDPLLVMGQPWEQPLGPDGWSEAPEDWILPQAMAGRISWAMQAPRALMETLPDPRGFSVTALGPGASPAVLFAAQAAETRRDGVGVVLASAEFQRR